MSGHLQHQRARRAVHPVEQHQVRAGLDILEAVGPARVDLDHANGLGLAGVLRAVLALLPGRVDAADEIEPGVGLLGQLDGLLAFPNAEIFGGHESSWIAGSGPAMTPGWAQIIRYFRCMSLP